MKDFSIIVPNLNQSHFLPTALESLKSQNASCEIAIMDGGSQDNVLNVISDYSDIITYFRSHRDSGQSAAINEGAKKVNGRYMAWLNADDYIFPYTLDYVKNVFNNHPDIDIVYGDAIHVDPKGNFLSYFPPIRKFDAHEITFNCFICQPACFMRSQVFQDVGGVNPNLHYTMDWDLWCRLSKLKYRFLYVKKPLAAVRYYRETKTLGGNHKRLLELYRIEKKYGNRRFKRSWLGSYYYGLKINRQGYRDYLFYFLLTGVYKAKNIFTNKNNMHNDFYLNYGFQRWKTIFQNKCEIHFPWYQKKHWKILRLALEPSMEMDSYCIKINDIVPKTIYRGRNFIEIHTDEPTLGYAKISIENEKDKKCELISFSAR